MPAQGCGLQKPRGQKPASPGGQDGAGRPWPGGKGHRHGIRWSGLWCWHWTTLPGEQLSKEWMNGCKKHFTVFTTSLCVGGTCWCLLLWKPFLFFCQFTRSSYINFCKVFCLSKRIVSQNASLMHHFSFFHVWETAKQKRIVSQNASLMHHFSFFHVWETAKHCMALDYCSLILWLLLNDPEQ